MSIFSEKLTLRAIAFYKEFHALWKLPCIRPNLCTRADLFHSRKFSTLSWQKCCGESKKKMHNKSAKFRRYKKTSRLISNQGDIERPKLMWSSSFPPRAENHPVYELGQKLKIPEIAGTVSCMDKYLFSGRTILAYRYLFVRISVTGLRTAGPIKLFAELLYLTEMTETIPLHLDVDLDPYRVLGKFAEREISREKFLLRRLHRKEHLDINPRILMTNRKLEIYQNIGKNTTRFNLIPSWSWSHCIVFSIFLFIYISILFNLILFVLLKLSFFNVLIKSYFDSNLITAIIARSYLILYWI